MDGPGAPPHQWPKLGDGHMATLCSLYRTWGELSFKSLTYGPSFYEMDKKLSSPGALSLEPAGGSITRPPHYRLMLRTLHAPPPSWQILDPPPIHTMWGYCTASKRLMVEKRFISVKLWYFTCIKVWTEWLTNKNNHVWRNKSERKGVAYTSPKVMVNIHTYTYILIFEDVKSCERDTCNMDACWHGQEIQQSWQTSALAMHLPVTSSPFSIHVRHILSTSKFQHSYSCRPILLMFYRHQWTACVRTESVNTVHWFYASSSGIPSE